MAPWALAESPGVARTPRSASSFTLPLPARVGTRRVTDIPHSFLTATSSSCKAMSFCSEPASLEDTYGLSLRGAGSILCGLKLMAAFC